MKHFVGILVLSAAAFIFYSCTGGEAPKGFVKYEMKTFEKSLGDTSAASKGFAKIKLVYPEITESTNSAILDVLYTYVRDQIFTALFREGRYKQPEFFAENFFNEYKKFTGDFDKQNVFWEVERKVNITYLNDRIVCFEYYEQSFLGGAHPNSNYFYTIYDLVTGGKLTAENIFLKGYETKLTSIAEKKFRETRGLQQNESLKEAGFSFPEGKFALNKNFGLTKEGVVFYYNKYEVAPYAFGKTSVVIPYSEIQDITDKVFIHGN